MANISLSLFRNDSGTRLVRSKTQGLRDVHRVIFCIIVLEYSRESHARNIIMNLYSVVTENLFRGITKTYSLGITI